MSGRWRVVLGAAILAIAAPVAGEDVSLTVSPEISAEPGRVTVRVSIEPDAGNRGLEVVAESIHFFRSSWKQLDGEEASRTSVFRYDGLPAGEYEVRAVLFGADGNEQGYARAKVTVVR